MNYITLPFSWISWLFAYLVLLTAEDTDDYLLCVVSQWPQSRRLRLMLLRPWSYNH